MTSEDKQNQYYIELHLSDLTIEVYSDDVDFVQTEMARWMVVFQDPNIVPAYIPEGPLPIPPTFVVSHRDEPPAPVPTPPAANNPEIQKQISDLMQQAQALQLQAQSLMSQATQSPDITPSPPSVPEPPLQEKPPTSSPLSFEMPSAEAALSAPEPEPPAELLAIAPPAEPEPPPEEPCEEVADSQAEEPSAISAQQSLPLFSQTLMLEPVGDPELEASEDNEPTIEAESQSESDITLFTSLPETGQSQDFPIADSEAPEEETALPSFEQPVENLLNPDESIEVSESEESKEMPEPSEPPLLVREPEQVVNNFPVVEEAPPRAPAAAPSENEFDTLMESLMADFDNQPAPGQENTALSARPSENTPSARTSPVEETVMLSSEIAEQMDLHFKQKMAALFNEEEIPLAQAPPEEATIPSPPEVDLPSFDRSKISQPPLADNKTKESPGLLGKLKRALTSETKPEKLHVPSFDSVLEAQDAVLDEPGKMDQLAERFEQEAPSKAEATPYLRLPSPTFDSEDMSIKAVVPKTEAPFGDFPGFETAPPADEEEEAVLDTLQSAFEVEQPVAAVAPLPGLPTFDEPTSEPSEEEALFESLKEALVEEDTLQAAAKASLPNLPSFDNQDMEPPKVDTSDFFGIPAPRIGQDPNIKHLSLETLQVDSTPFDTRGESPFPDPDDEEIANASASKGEKWATSKTASEADEEALPQDIESLLELCELAPNASSSSDFLMLAAYFLIQYKSMETFSLKDLNAQLVRSGLTPINHGILETVLAEQYLGLIPDLTGNANAAEYTLTEAGRAYTENLIEL